MSGLHVIRLLLSGLLLLLSASCSQKIYVVRHAEKETVGGQMMSQDPPLTAAGKARAVALRETLRHKGIDFVFSTNTIRTISTAAPLNEMRGNTRIQLYSSKPDSLGAFISRLRKIRRGNILVVGHSNTIDDIANQLCGKIVVDGDLADAAYNNLFVIQRKGNHYFFSRKKYGE